MKHFEVHTTNGVWDIWEESDEVLGEKLVEGEGLALVSGSKVWLMPKHIVAIVERKGEES